LCGELAEWFRATAERRAREAGVWRSGEVVANDVGCGLLLVALGDERGKSELANSVAAGWLGCDPRTFQRYKNRADNWAGAIKRILRGNPKDRLSTVCQVTAQMPNDKLGAPRGLLFDAVRFYGTTKAVWAAVLMYENPAMRGPRLAEAMGLDRGTGRRLWRRLRAVVEQWRATIDGIGPGPTIERARQRRQSRNANAQPNAKALPDPEPPPDAEGEAEPLGGGGDPPDRAHTPQGLIDARAAVAELRKPGWLRERADRP